VATKSNEKKIRQKSGSHAATCLLNGLEDSN